MTDITRQENPPEPEVDLEDYYDRQVTMYLNQGMSEEDAWINAAEDCANEEQEILERRRCCPNGCRGLCE